MKKFVYFTLFTIHYSLSFSQDSAKVNTALFEGVVTYNMQELSPNENLISDKEFFKDSKNGAKSTVKLYIKGNQYKWEYPERVEIYLPSKNQIAIYPKDGSDSIYYAYASIAEEPLVKIEKSNLSKRLQNYDLTAYVVHTKWDQRTLFYNPTALKTNPGFWKNHNREYLSNFIQKSSCFPLMIHQKSLFGTWVMIMSSIESKKLTEEEFNLPKK